MSGFGTAWVHSARSTVAGLCLMMVAALLVVTPAASADDAPLPDGLSAPTAAGSCWEIKQHDPGVSDGVYWLVTPSLVAPEQFYCDMTTDGGGWVLVGRGREGWRTNYEGRGTAAQVRGVVDGPSAFVPAQLSSLTIDGLLDGGRVDGLVDPIRLRRAQDVAGEYWQEVRFRFLTRDRWVWTFPAEHRVGAWSFEAQLSPSTGTGSGSGGQTNNFGNNQTFRRVITTATSAQGWTHGWSYGSSITGTNSSSSYLWSNTTGGGNARPFTQMFLRPRLMLADLEFPTIPVGGAAAEPVRPLLNNGVLPGEWGVTGLANGRNTELTPEVSAFAQIGNRVYVGGNFRWAQRGAGATSPPDRVEQSYLAAFDVNTGAFIPQFAPQFNEQVKSLAVLPDGTLAVGGEFTQANGQTAVGFARLNATTGATAPGWTLNIENRLSGGGLVSVRAMHERDGALYLGGLFTHISSSQASGTAYMRMAGKVSSTTGTPAFGWNPDLSGSVIDLDVSQDGTRVYASGYFREAGGLPAPHVAALSAADASLVGPAWEPEWSTPFNPNNPQRNYQQMIMEVGDRVWSGGSEHNLFSFDRNSFERLSGNITKQGGDFQAVATANGVVYAGCHCDQWNYSNAFTWSNVGTNWTQADKIGFVGAWDAVTGEVIPEFNPVFAVRAGYGPWAQFFDSNGNMWVGGDLTNTVRANGSVQWTGGFARLRAP
jgi:trimeric autotransporter adhesin